LSSEIEATIFKVKYVLRIIPLNLTLLC